MTLQQLRALCIIVDQGLHLSNAAKTLHRSQPALTRQLQALEHHLGADIFERKRNRIVELTPVGRDILLVARRVVGEALRRIDARHLFRPSSLCVVLRKGSYLRRYMSDFIQAFAPTLTATEIERAMEGKPVSPNARPLIEP